MMREFSLLDGSRFPVIRMERHKLTVGGIEAMIADFESLLASGQVFVLAMAGERHAEPSHDDQKRWILWLKENRERMAALCRGVVSVADPASDLTVQQKQAAGMQGMLGIPVKLASTAEEAEQVAAELLN